MKKRKRRVCPRVASFAWSHTCDPPGACENRRAWTCAPRAVPRFVRCGGRCDIAPPRNPVAVSPSRGGNGKRSETRLCRWCDLDLSVNGILNWPVAEEGDSVAVSGSVPRWWWWVWRPHWHLRWPEEAWLEEKGLLAKKTLIGMCEEDAVVANVVDSDS